MQKLMKLTMAVTTMLTAAACGQSSGDRERQGETRARDSAYVTPPQRDSIRAQGAIHTRPIIQWQGRTLLWANGDPMADRMQWFDMTDSLIDPARFQYGIGRDTIPSVDEPRFLAHSDDALRTEFGINDATVVIGFEHNGIARAYPVAMLNRHEVVNDEFDGEPFAVCW